MPLVGVPRLGTSACRPSAPAEIHLSLGPDSDTPPQTPEVRLHSFQFLGSKLRGLPALSRLSFTPPAVLSNLDPASAVSIYSFIFDSAWEAFVSQLRMFFCIPHLLGLLPKSSMFPGVLSGLFTCFGMAVSRTFCTNFGLATLSVKTVRRSDTCSFKDLAGTTTHSEEGGKSRQDVARSIYPFHSHYV